MFLKFCLLKILPLLTKDNEISLVKNKNVTTIYNLGGNNDD